jgi:hypothetical protein
MMNNMITKEEVVIEVDTEKIEFYSALVLTKNEQNIQYFQVADKNDNVFEIEINMNHFGLKRNAFTETGIPDKTVICRLKTDFVDISYHGYKETTARTELHFIIEDGVLRIKDYLASKCIGICVIQQLPLDTVDFTQTIVGLYLKGNLFV